MTKAEIHLRNAWNPFRRTEPPLGILVPPIGAIILVDQYLVRKGSEIEADWRGTAFLAWAFGSAVAFVVEWYFPYLSTAISAGLVGGVAYYLLSSFTANTARA